MKRVGRVAIPNDVLDRILELERRLDDLEGMAALPAVDLETGGDTYITMLVEGDDYWLRLDCSNDPLTNSLEIEGNVNLNAAGAELQIEGDHALSIEDTDGNRTNVQAGVLAGDLSEIAESTYTVAIGRWAHRKTSGYNNVAVGANAMYLCGDATGTNVVANVAVGTGAMSSISLDPADWEWSGGNVAVGDGALSDALEPSYSVAVGESAGTLQGTTPMRYTVGVGRRAFAGEQGVPDVDHPGATRSVGLGTDVCYKTTETIDSVVGGYRAGYQGTLVEDSVVFGFEAAYGGDTTGSVILGYQAGYNISTDNVLIIENSNDISTPLIYGEFDNDLVRINGTLDVTGNITPGNVANDDTTPGIPVLFPIAISGGAAGDTDITIDGKHRIIDVWAQHTGGAGEASDTIQVKNGANAITDAMDWSGADNSIVRASSIDDAQYEIADSGTLRVTTTDNDAGGDVGAGLVYVLAIPVA